MRTFPFNELRPVDEALRELHRAHRVSPVDAHTLRHADVARWLAQFANRSTASGSDYPLEVRAVGESFEGRTIRLASIGRGARHVLLWTQMHGDEPTHTAVVLDLLGALITQPEPLLAGCPLLERCTLHVLPMLNPDGAERQIRENAQQIDINRDAVDLATPEGRVLAQITRELRPALGFNLHNQSAEKQVADTGRPAAVSVMAPPLNKQLTVTPSVVRAKQLALEMFAAAERSLPGHATKYDADYMPTAFGEWVQARGVTTVLLEAGGWPEDKPEEMTQLHFVVLGSALRAIGENLVEDIDAARYEELPLNTRPEK